MTTKSRRRRDRQAAKLSRANEPRPNAEDDDWVEWGGELMLAAGFTSGGAPYGLTVDEFRAGNERFEAGRGWVRAKTALRATFEEACGPRSVIDVDWVSRIGEGLSRDVFAAEVRICPDARRLSGTWAALVPRRDADPELPERTVTEVRLLEHLGRQPLPFHLPRAMLAPGTPGILVRQYVPGVPLEMGAGRQPGVRPWSVIGGLAAAVHRMDVSEVRDTVPGYGSRRQHAEVALQALEGFSEPEARDALAWARENLPPDAPSILLHGDMLGQNIIVDLAKPERVGLIDWEHAQLGDPGYDLAIVTRTHRQPFQLANGMQRLVEAYLEAGGEDVRVAHVYVHELALAGAWYREALLQGDSHAGNRNSALGQLRGVLRRAMAKQTTSV